MKRTITLLSILILLIVATAMAFAANTGATVKLQTAINQEEPTYGIYGSLSEGEAGTLEGFTKGTQAGAVLNSGVDLSINDLSVYIRLMQESIARFSGTVRLTVSASELVNTVVQSGVSQTDIPRASELIAKNRTGYTITVTNGQAMNDVIYNIIYDGKYIQGQTEIGSFTYTWDSNIGLSAGEYQATISLVFDIDP